MRRNVFLSLSVALAVGLLVVVAVASSATRATPATTQAKMAITPSPAYTAKQLNTYPGENWLTVAGDLRNDRFSTLKQITPSNVGTLKQAWHIHLGTCPTHDQQCGSYEGNAVVADGVYYIVTPRSDVFALDATLGSRALALHADPRSPASRRRRFRDSRVSRSATARSTSARSTDIWSRSTSRRATSSGRRPRFRGSRAVISPPRRSTTTE